MTLGWPFLKASLYRAACPGNVDSPLAILEAISQVNDDSVENISTYTIQEYYLLVCTTCLPLVDPFPIYAVSHFVRHVEPQIKNDVESR